MGSVCRYHRPEGSDRALPALRAPSRIRTRNLPLTRRLLLAVELRGRPPGPWYRVICGSGPLPGWSTSGRTGFRATPRSAHFIQRPLKGRRLCSEVGLTRTRCSRRARTCISGTRARRPADWTNEHCVQLGRKRGLPRALLACLMETFAMLALDITHEPYRGVEPRSPGWKPGALPLS